MIQKFCLFLLFLGALKVDAQTIAAKLNQAVVTLEKTAAMQGGVLAIAVQDASTGEWIYRKNSSMGLPAASTQKIITAATAYELLGKEYQYKTQLFYTGKIENGSLKGDIHFLSSGDPTLGSWRWEHTVMDTIVSNILKAFQKEGIQSVEGNIYLHETAFDFQSTPPGYTYQDMGNYYGAGSWSLNWNENQFDFELKPGQKIGDTTELINTHPSLLLNKFHNAITTAAAGTGDKSYIYITPYAQYGYGVGTIPMGKNFKVTGSMPYPALVFAQTLELSFAQNGIVLHHPITTFPLQKYELKKDHWIPFHSIESPSMDKISYWFLRKSVNLYGEVMVKTLDAQQNQYASLDGGLKILQSFWERNGIAKHHLKMMDGSGLSPENRITAEALVRVLQYARKQSWYASYIDGFPLYNNMKIKSGTISGVKAFAGVHRSKAGKEYNLAIIAYNYNGTSNNIVQEIYKILNHLK